MNRAQAMETKEFIQRMGDKVREEDHEKRILTDEAISIFLYYTHNRKEPDFANGGRHLHECLAPMADKIIDEIIEANEIREKFPEWHAAVSETRKLLYRIEP